MLLLLLLLFYWFSGSKRGHNFIITAINRFFNFASERKLVATISRSQNSENSPYQYVLHGVLCVNLCLYPIWMEIKTFFAFLFCFLYISLLVNIIIRFTIFKLLAQFPFCEKCQLNNFLFFTNLAIAAIISSFAVGAYLSNLVRDSLLSF
jgi:heme/copper-type cytochrome/quinol oxidase subunit 4